MKTPYFVLNCFFQLIVNETELGKSWRTHNFNGKKHKRPRLTCWSLQQKDKQLRGFLWDNSLDCFVPAFNLLSTLGSLTHSLIKIEKLKLKLLRVLAWNADSSKHLSSQRTLSGKDIESTSCIKIHWAYFYTQISLFPTALSSIDQA